MKTRIAKDFIYRVIKFAGSYWALKQIHKEIMVKKLFILAFRIIIFPLFVAAQQANSPNYAGYIAKYKDIAVSEMKIYHIPASITLAQGIIESNCGKSPLASEANNHFGVKCHKDWNGDTYLFDDDEKGECFRKYSSAEESFRDHSLFLVNKQRYAALFSLDLTDYTGWAMGLKQAGYATNPDYPKLLIRMIENNKLFLYDDTTSNNLAINTYIKNTEEAKGNDNGNKNQIPGQARLFNKKYKMPDPSAYQLHSVSKHGRNVYENNGIPFIFINKGDTWFSIASEFGIYSNQVYHENDMKESDKLVIGQIIYLEPKKRRSDIKSHVFQEDETLFSISQLYGIKLRLLCKYNNLIPGDIPVPGTTLQLEKTGRLFR